MDYSQVDSILTSMRDAATSCLSVPFCAYIWPGDVSPLSCENGVSVSLSASFGAKADGCHYLESLEIRVYLDVCQGEEPDTAEDATRAACSFYKHIVEVSNGLRQWHRDNWGCATSVIPGGFRYHSSNEDGCLRYASDWTIGII